MMFNQCLILYLFYSFMNTESTNMHILGIVSTKVKKLAIAIPNECFILFCIRSTLLDLYLSLLDKTSSKFL